MRMWLLVLTLAVVSTGKIEAQSYEPAPIYLDEKEAQLRVMEAHSRWLQSITDRVAPPRHYTPSYTPPSYTPPTPVYRPAPPAPKTTPSSTYHVSYPSYPSVDLYDLPPQYAPAYGYQRVVIYYVIE